MSDTDSNAFLDCGKSALISILTFEEDALPFLC